MRRIGRRRFLDTLARSGAGVVALGALPSWIRAALAAAGPGGGPRGSAGPAPELIERNAWPEHWETTLPALGRSWITRNDRFFVRNHFPAPEVNPAAWRLEVTGLVRTPLSLSLAEIQSLPPIEAIHTLECAGNGRGLYRLPSTSGTQWERGAVGTASWGGTRLATVLQRAGLAPEARHAWFEAADQAPLAVTPRFLRSIPIEKAMSDALLVHAMNGEPLPRLHGAPLRVIVPGWYAMASTKWVTRVRLEAAPSDNHFMANGYRYVYPETDPAGAPPVEEMRVKSVITAPLEGARVPPGRVRIQGFAWAGPRGVRIVEISPDGGRSWQPAGFMGENAPLAWRAWATELEAKSPVTLTVLARATDGAGEMQPLEARTNGGGYANNSVHRVKFRVSA